jgi:hypothetical protein
MFGTAKPAAKDTQSDLGDSGREFLRRALKHWSTKADGLAFVNRTVPGAPGLEAMTGFVRGQVPTLSADALRALARALFRAEYLPDIDKLRLLSRAEPLPAPPPRIPFQPQTDAQRRIHALMNTLRAEREAEAAARAPKISPEQRAAYAAEVHKRRPGWI